MNEEAPQGDADGPEGSTGRESEEGLSRRRVLATGAATWATVSLAGCTYITDPGTETPTVTTETSTTDEEGSTPVNGETPTDGNETEGGESTTTSGPTTTACSSSNIFQPGMEIGLHVTVFDSETGDVLSDDAIESVLVSFPDADIEPMELNWEGAHEEYSLDTWGSKLVTDANIDPDTYNYEVTVLHDDETTTTITDQFKIV